MSVPTEFHSTLRRTYHTLCISIRQSITEDKAKWNEAADVWDICFRNEVYNVSANRRPRRALLIFGSVRKTQNWWRTLRFSLLSSSLNSVQHVQRRNRKYLRKSETGAVILFFRSAQNINLVGDGEISKFRWIPFSGCRGGVEVYAGQRTDDGRRAMTRSLEPSAQVS